MYMCIRVYVYVCVCACVCVHNVYIASKTGNLKPNTL
jgi:hypothetical protein